MALAGARNSAFPGRTLRLGADEMWSIVNYTRRSRRSREGGSEKRRGRRTHVMRNTPALDAGESASS